MSFTIQQLPSLTDMRIQSVTSDRERRVIVAGSWPAQAGYRASVAIDPQTADGIVEGYYTYGQANAGDQGVLGAGDRKMLVNRAYMLVKSGAVASTENAWAALNVLIAKC